MQYQAPSSPTSYFTSIPSYGNEPYEYKAENSVNIDDLVYRYSHEYERDRGTPTTGIYAQDGFWDEDESVGHSTTGANTTSTANTSGVDLKSLSLKSATASLRTRSRSATVSTVLREEGTNMWGWKQRGEGSDGLALEMEKEPEVKGKSLRKERSKSFLKGKGRRGEMSIILGEPGSLVSH
jgi:hypothetical protein